jgi:cellulose synthase/poly-beta-1,6-N-acetylglucosamine synthase-like glycosyltransferase
VLQSPDLPQTVFQRKWDPFKYFELGDSEVELPYWKFWACQISLKRSFLLENGLFREHKGAAHEDVELGYRLWRKGLRIIYLPRALGNHYHPENLQQAIRRAYERGRHWRFIEENVPDPQIWVKYHILNRRTIGYHLTTFRNLSQTQLPAEDRNVPLLLAKYFIRWSMFNRLTIPIWIHLLQKAEDNPRLAALLHPYCYRGTVFYHFIKGHTDEVRSRSSEAVPRATADSSSA